MCNIVDFRGYLFTEKILDVGAGGEEIILNATTGKSVTALVKKKSEISHSKFNNSPNVKWVYGDACKLKFPDETFSTVTMFCTLMYIRGIKEKLQVLSECIRVLKSEGKLYVWDFDIAIDSEMFNGNLEVILPGKRKSKSVGYGIGGVNLKQDFDEIKEYIEKSMTIEVAKLEDSFFTIIAQK
ncbi:MAG: class I SAM-dependent methyltransferase [Halanaerobiales bacterium]|nr:class I SAM-dependent methyltransferase [Halanaerobiales bacterium]